MGLLLPNCDLHNASLKFSLENDIQHWCEIISCYQEMKHTHPNIDYKLENRCSTKDCNNETENVLFTLDRTDAKYWGFKEFCNDGCLYTYIEESNPV